MTARHHATARGTAGLPDRLWTLPQTADFLGMTVPAVHCLISRGRFCRTYKVGRQRRVDPRDLRAWLDSRASDATDPPTTGIP